MNPEQQPFMPLEQEAFQKPPSVLDDVETYRSWVGEYVNSLPTEELYQLQSEIHQRRAEDNILESVIIERRTREGI